MVSPRMYYRSFVSIGTDNGSPIGWFGVKKVIRSIKLIAPIIPMDSFNELILENGGVILGDVAGMIIYLASVGYQLFNF